MQYVPNELDSRLLGVAAIDPGSQWISASRRQMLGTHLPQHLVIHGHQERLFQSGNESKFGEYTYSVKMPVNGSVIAVIDRYPITFGGESINYNPETIVVFEDVETKTVDYLSLPRYCSMHSYFGFEYKQHEAFQKLYPGATISAGETFLDSPAINANKGYEYGTNMNVAFMGHRGVAEDAIIFSKSGAKKLSSYKYEKRVASFGSKHFPLNTYGNDEVYKIFPDIGEQVRPDGLLIAMREYNDLMGPVEQTRHALQQIDYMFDKTVYVDPGTVVDIKVFRQNGVQPNMPEQAEAQLLKYDRARRIFYEEIYNLYRSLRRKHQYLSLSENFATLVRTAISIVGTNSTAPNENIRLVHRQEPLDEWRVEFVVRYELVPKKGFKATSLDGGKGVICEIWPDEHMPVDAHGNRAEAIMDDHATVNRMNYSRFYEVFFNSAARDTVRAIILKLGFAQEVVDQAGSGSELVSKERQFLYKRLQEINQRQPELIEWAFNELMTFYEMVSPKQRALFQAGRYRHQPVDHLKHVIDHYLQYRQGFFIYFPPNNEVMGMAAVEAIQERFKPLWAPVTMADENGEYFTTTEPVRIAPVYVISLEKIADTAGGVASCRYQHHGVPAQLSNTDKYAKPVRIQPVRLTGESENRVIASYAGGDVVAEIQDRNNNPQAQRAIVQSILESETPAMIEKVIDREKVPMGDSKVLKLTQHVGFCAGWEFIYEKPYMDEIQQAWRDQYPHGE